MGVLHLSGASSSCAETKEVSVLGPRNIQVSLGAHAGFHFVFLQVEGSMYQLWTVLWLGSQTKDMISHLGIPTWHGHISKHNHNVKSAEQRIPELHIGRQATPGIVATLLAELKDHVCLVSNNNFGNR